MRSSRLAASKVAIAPDANRAAYGVVNVPPGTSLPIRTNGVGATVKVAPLDARVAGWALMLADTVATATPTAIAP